MWLVVYCFVLRVLGVGRVGAGRCVEGLVLGWLTALHQGGLTDTVARTSLSNIDALNQLLRLGFTSLHIEPGKLSMDAAERPPEAHAVCDEGTEKVALRTDSTSISGGYINWHLIMPYANGTYIKALEWISEIRMAKPLNPKV